MAMACGDGSAAVALRPQPVAVRNVPSAPSMTARRDAPDLEAKMGAGWARMRFVSDFAQFNTGVGPWRAAYFGHIRGFIAGAISAITQPNGVTLPPYFVGKDPI